MTSRLEIVPAQFVYHVWDRVEPFLSKGLARAGGEYNTDQLKVYLVQGEQTLCIFIDDEGTIHGALTVKFINYPNNRIAYVVALGGKAIAERYLWDQFETWMRTQGATKMRGAAFESVARLWRKQFGVQTRYLVVEKDL